MQVAKKASVLKRRKSKNRMEPPSSVQSQGNNGNADRLENEGDVVFYMEEPKAGTPNRYDYSRNHKSISHKLGTLPADRPYFIVQSQKGR